MIVLIVPKGRGNWKKVSVAIQTPALLLEVRERDDEVRVGTEWFLAGRWWRVVEVWP